MKAVIAYVLIFTHLLAAAYISAEAHYCGGELSKVSVKKEAATCGMCSKDDPHGCCQDETLVWSLSDYSAAVADASKIVLPYSWLPYTYVVVGYGSGVQNTDLSRLLPDLLPPPLLVSDFLAWVQVYRI